MWSIRRPFSKRLPDYASSASRSETHLFLSDRAQLILPYHRVIEAISEERLGANKIGTTCRGIGPAYEDKIGRRGIRVGDLRHPGRLREKLEFIVAEKNALDQCGFGQKSPSASKT